MKSCTYLWKDNRKKNYENVKIHLIFFSFNQCVELYRFIDRNCFSSEPYSVLASCYGINEFFCDLMVLVNY